MKTSKFTQALAVIMNTKKVSDKSVIALQASLLRGMKLSANPQIRTLLGV